MRMRFLQRRNAQMVRTCCIKFGCVDLESHIEIHVEIQVGHPMTAMVKGVNEYERAHMAI
jgi:hypothetical protein